MIKMTTVQARENFAELINQAAYGNNRVVLTRRGKALAAVISMQDLQDLVAKAQANNYGEAAV